MAKTAPTLAEASNAQPGSAPKSFIIRLGPVTKTTSQLVTDLRRAMEPNTATRLRERRSNRLKDYASVAGPLGVSHFFVLSQTEESVSLRMARFANGPTCHFRVDAFSLVRDVLAQQRRPRPPGADAFRSAPLLVLNNFDLSTSHGKLLCSFLQNAFPTLNTKRLKLADLRRVVLFEYNREDDTVDFRHYSIGVKTTGISKPVKRLLLSNRPTDLASFADISDFVLRPSADLTSESEAEEDAMVTLPQDFRGQKKNARRAVNLTEIGPRMKLRLAKIVDGFCDGQALFRGTRSRAASE